MPLERTHEPAGERRRRAGRREAPPRRSPAVDALLRAQAGGGNALVARAVLARRPAKQYTVDAGGFLVVDGARVGWDGAPAHVCVDPKSGEAGVPLASAGLGTLTPGGGLIAVREATVDKTDPANVKVTPKGPSLGLRYDAAAGTLGDPVMTKPSDWQPVAFKDLKDDVKKVLATVKEPHLRLTDGRFFALMEFSLRGDTTPRHEWGQAKTDDLKAGRAKLTGQEAKPPTRGLKDQVEAYAGVIPAVMAHEGRFEDASMAGDPMASIGIFQWSMAKSSTSNRGASAVAFFAKLKDRATNPPAGVDPAEQKLYTDAWAQVTAHKIDVDAAGDVVVDGKKATGADIESALTGKGGAMDTGALRSYQLVAATDWIEAFRNDPIRPSDSFAGWVGQDYVEPAATPQGSKVRLIHKHGKLTHELELDMPAGTATVGSTFPTQKNLALAVTLGVNRPHWVEAALWRALTAKQDIKAEAEARMEEISAAHLAADKKAPGWHVVSAADIKAWGAQAAYDGLAREIWPAAKALNAAQEEDMATEFKRNGLLMSPRGQATSLKRWERFATVEAAYAP